MGEKVKAILALIAFSAVFNYGLWMWLTDDSHHRQIQEQYIAPADKALIEIKERNRG